MKANCWMGTRHVEVTDVPDPTILNPRDAIVRITNTAICGSDLHLYNGWIPTMKRGDVLGHEFMGEVVETGKSVTNLKKGDRVVVPFPIACGHCLQCEREMYSLCENTNPNAWMAEKMWGYSPCGIFGYSHMLGGYPGGQAEYARVPFADVGPIKIPEELSDEQVLFLSDIFPTGYMAADMCGIQPGDVVAVFGCGPVGQMAIKSAYLLGAERVIAIDRFDYRMRIARDRAGAETLNYEDVNVPEVLREMTGGRGPDHCIDAVGLEGHAPGLHGAYDTGEDVDDARNRPSTGAASGDHGVPQRRHGVGGWRVRRIHRQVPDRRHRQSFADHPLRSVPRAALHASAAGAHSEWRDRSELHHHASTSAGSSRRGLRPVHEQGRRVPEGGAEDSVSSVGRGLLAPPLPTPRHHARIGQYTSVRQSFGSGCSAGSVMYDSHGAPPGATFWVSIHRSIAA